MVPSWIVGSTGSLKSYTVGKDSENRHRSCMNPFTAYLPLQFGLSAMKATPSNGSK
jgi:hypothetical protein